jgi:hypothetical protein
LAHLLGEVAEEARGPRQQRRPPQKLRREAEVGEGRARNPRAVDRQPRAGLLLICLGDHAQQAEVRPELARLLRDRVYARGARVLDLVDRVSEAGDPAARGDPLFHGTGRRLAQPGRGGVRAGLIEKLIQEARGVLDHAQEHAPGAQEPGRDRTLDRLGGPGMR